jgi:dGTPase
MGTSFAEIERLTLAGYAQAAASTNGRQYPEQVHPYRSEFQRDRERIIHSAAFRRLEYKTQVFVNHEGDNYRTRLTHTIEVAQISRSLARALQVNEDLAEAVALAHDLGHTPFGHSGEAILNKLLKDNGITDGFSHNRQSLRVVDILEQRYPEYRGLNLTYETREGIVKHETIYDLPTPQNFHPEWQCSLEGQIVNLADEIAYNSHDIDDGLRSRILTWEELGTLQLWRELYEESQRVYPHLDDRQRRHHLIRRMIDRQVTDVVDTTTRRLHDFGISTPDDVRTCPEVLVAFSTPFAAKLAAVKRHLFEHMYRHYRLIRMEQKARLILTRLFEAYMNNTDQIAPGFRRRMAGEETIILVCDYIAGMTDRFAMLEYKKLFDPFERV